MSYYRAARVGWRGAVGLRDCLLRTSGGMSFGTNSCLAQSSAASGSAPARTALFSRGLSLVAMALMTAGGSCAAMASSTSPDTIPVDKLVCHRHVGGQPGPSSDVSDVSSKRPDSPNHSPVSPSSQPSTSIKTQQPVILVSCGSFNPPTIAHIKLLDIVRDAYLQKGVDVYGAYLSPVHDAYGKPGLVDASHRVEMCRLAAEASAFVMVDAWEATRSGYTRTLHVLDSVDERLRLCAQRSNEEKDGEDGHERVRGAVDAGTMVPRTVLVCGADVLESMSDPHIWDQVLLEALLRRHGVACVVREGTDVRRVCDRAGTLVERWREHVMVVEAGEEDMRLIAGVSSSKVRCALRGDGGDGVNDGRQHGETMAVNDMVDARVLEYIDTHALYS